MQLPGNSSSARENEAGTEAEFTGTMMLTSLLPGSYSVNAAQVCLNRDGTIHSWLCCQLITSQEDAPQSCQQADLMEAILKYCLQVYQIDMNGHHCYDATQSTKISKTTWT